MPELLYISVYKDLHDFQMKRVDRKTGEVKNANVQGRLTVRTYTDNNKSSAVYIDRLFDTVNNIRKREKKYPDGGRVPRRFLINIGNITGCHGKIIGEGRQDTENDT